MRLHTSPSASSQLFDARVIIIARSMQSAILFDHFCPSVRLASIASKLMHTSSLFDISGRGTVLVLFQVFFTVINSNGVGKL